MAKKIGIVSLFEGYNFGNKLQNYAVEILFLNLGFETYTFKYEINHNRNDIFISFFSKINPKYIINYIRIHLGYKIPMKNSCYSLFKRLTNLLPSKQIIINKVKKDRKEAYNKFDKNYLHISKHIIKLNEIDTSWCNNFSYFFCGSDQVWNPYYASTSSISFLQFAPKEKRFSIAASFGVSEIPESRKEDYKKWLNDISLISVREERGREIIKELTGRESTVLVDPTMLITKEQWIQVAKKPEFILPENYLLSYFLGDRIKKYDQCQKQIANSNNLEIVNLYDLMQSEYYSCSPDEFIYCLMNAKYVCTDSFHACVFAILFEKDFLVFERVEGKRIMTSRINTLLDKFMLEDRLYYGEDINMHSIDYSKTFQILENERNKAKRFINDAINSR